MNSNKKDYFFIILVLFMVITIAFISSNAHQRLENESPDKLTRLTTDDFTLDNKIKPIIVGVSTGEDVQHVYPKGKTLGMSSVYRPAGQESFFTFTKKSDILTKVDITGPGLTTFRGITVNNSFAKVVRAYGKGYKKSYLKNDPDTFDAIYGIDKYIVFHVKGGIVQRIVLEHPLVDSKK